MRIIDLLKTDAIELNTSAASKSEAIEKMVSLHQKAGNLNDAEAYTKAILAREEQGSTAIGEGIAVPHAKSESVKTPGLAAITVPAGVDYGAPDLWLCLWTLISVQSFVRQKLPKSTSKSSTRRRLKSIPKNLP